MWGDFLATRFRPRSSEGQPLSGTVVLQHLQLLVRAPNPQSTPDEPDEAKISLDLATPVGDASNAFHLRRRFFFFFLGGVGSGFRSSVGSRISSVGGGLVPPKCPEAFGAGSRFEPAPVACKEAS